MAGTFESVINSIFPIVGGGGVANANKIEENIVFEMRKLKEIVKNCIKIV